jgi:hypothetical protein
MIRWNNRNQYIYTNCIIQLTIPIITRYNKNFTKKKKGKSDNPLEFNNINNNIKRVFSFKTEKVNILKKSLFKSFFSNKL